MKKGVKNLLLLWKQECDLLSTSLSINSPLYKRRDIETVFNVLSGYFGLEYFIANEEYNWIHYLLVNHKRSACIIALFEITNTLDYLKTTNPSTQSKFKSLFNDPRQFRDLFFELYLTRLLNQNGILTQKIKEDQQELDILCTIDNIEYLCECKKPTAPDNGILNSLGYILENLQLQIEKASKGIGFIATIKIHNLHEAATRNVFIKKISLFFNRYNTEKFSTIDYKDIDQYGEFCVFNYSDINNADIESRFSEYDLVFKLIPPTTIIPNKPNLYNVELKSKFEVLQWKIDRKIGSILRGAVSQHSNSKYKNKIYFIDNEIMPEFSLPLFRMDSMFNETKILELVKTLPEDEILCFINREYLDAIPNVSIKAYGKDATQNVRKRLESLRTNFDYSVKTQSQKMGTN